MNPLILNTHVVRTELDHRRSEFARAQKPARRRSSIRRGVAVLAAAFAALLIAAASALGTTDTSLVNMVPGGFTDDSSHEAAVSKNGRFVAFSSYATNLSADDGDGARDVFVRDMREETIVLVSRSNGIDGAGGQADSYEPSISANGRYVAFTSLYDEFTDEDHAGLDVFVRDLNTGTTTLVSRASGMSGEGGDANSHSPSISADGRYVAFESNADNLGEDANDVGNIFVRDLEKGRTVLISRPPGKVGGGANGTSASPSISADGKRVAFESVADNLSGSDDDGFENVFVRDVRRSDTLLVSKGSDNDSFDPAISADGTSVAFVSRAGTFSPAADNSFYDVFVRDLVKGRTVLASRRSGRTGDAAKGSSFVPSLSRNGQIVVFNTLARNLSSEDSDQYDDVFVRDMRSNTTTLVSSANDGGPASGDSFVPSVSANGGFAVFESEANNLISGDVNAFPDVFRTPVQLGPDA